MMSCDDEVVQGVGARRLDGPLQSGGGGSLDSCTTPEFALKADHGQNLRDPRLRDLERVGLGADFLALAEDIGVDAFLTVWRFMSARRDVYRKVTMPDYGSYERFQRNCYIRSLASEGHDVKEIRKIVSKVLGEHLSERTICRAAK